MSFRLPAHKSDRRFSSSFRCRPSWIILVFEFFQACSIQLYHFRRKFPGILVGTYFRSEPFPFDKKSVFAICRKDSYEFGKTKKILSSQRDISISWNAFRSEPTLWSSSFYPKYFSDPSKFDDPRTPEGPTSRTSRDILVTSKYSKSPSKSTKKTNKNNFTNFI